MAIYTDQTIAGNYDPGASSVPFTATIITMEINDANNDGFISVNGLDQVNGSNVTSVWVGDEITLNGATILGVTFYTADGGRYFTPSDDTVLEDGTITAQTFVNTSTQFPIGDFGPPCFVAGTRIDVPGGQALVEDLVIGDLVKTRDHGPQAIRWIGSRTVSGRGAFSPVRFARGALGNHDDVTVSPQHRIMLDDWRAAFYLGEDEVLSPAHMLVNGDTIDHVPCSKITYVHFMFDTHEIVYANGLPSESFLFGEYLCHETSALRAEIDRLCPKISASGHKMKAARRILRAHEAHLFQTPAEIAVMQVA